jgi:hypothetical protein
VSARSEEQYWAPITEPLSDQLFVFFPVNLNRPALADFAAQFMKKHADQLVGHIRLGPPRGGT